MYFPNVFVNGQSVPVNDLANNLVRLRSEYSGRVQTVIWLSQSGGDQVRNMILAMKPEEIDSYVQILTAVTTATPTAGQGPELVVPAGDLGTFEITQIESDGDISLNLKATLPNPLPNQFVNVGSLNHESTVERSEGF